MEEPPRGEARARDVEQLARLLDARFRIPGTPFRFGFDFLLGLVPVLGDLAAGGAALWIVARALTLGASASVIARMLLNVLADVVMGLVPLAGDVADTAYKANLRNARLLQRHLESPESTRRRSRGVVALWIAGVALVFLAAAVALGFLVVALTQALAGS